MTPTEETLRRLESRLSGTQHAAYFSEMRRRYRFIVDAVRRCRASGRLLDVGCAPGHLTWLCRKTGFDVAGVDLFPEQCFVGGGKGTQLDLLAEENIPVKQVDVRTAALPFPDTSFDIALFNETIEHLEGGPEGALKEIRRVLQPGGRMFLTTPNVAAIRNRLRLLAGKNIYTQLDVLRTVAPHKLHHREYTLAELVELAMACGFRPVRAQHLHFGKGRPADAVFRAATALCPSLRSNLYLEAERA